MTTPVGAPAQSVLTGLATRNAPQWAASGPWRFHVSIATHRSHDRVWALSALSNPAQRDCDTWLLALGESAVDVDPRFAWRVISPTLSGSRLSFRGGSSEVAANEHDSAGLVLASMCSQEDVWRCLARLSVRRQLQACSGFLRSVSAVHSPRSNSALESVVTREMWARVRLRVLQHPDLSVVKLALDLSADWERTLTSEDVPTGNELLQAAVTCLD
jgi:hypothetical protein